MRIAGWVLAGIGIGLAGCAGTTSGGNGGGSNNDSPYIGVYKGTFYQNNNTWGTVNLSISISGIVTGTTTQTSSGSPQTSTVGGTVTDAGSMSIGLNGSAALTGNVTTAGSPTLDAQVASPTNTLWLTLLRDPSAPGSGGNPFAGDYDGTVTNSGTGKTGTFAIVIDSMGNITGYEYANETGNSALATISGTVSASGAINYSVNVNGASVTSVSGAVSLASGLLSSPSLASTAGGTLALAATQVQ